MVRELKKFFYIVVPIMKPSCSCLDYACHGLSDDV